MKILVCGGRDFTNVHLLHKTLDHLLKEYKFDTIIEGDARGADRMAGRWADENHLEHLIFPAQWQKFGNRAGPIRNLQMLDEGKPDLVIAFPGGKGTAHMVKIARGRGIRVLEVKDRGSVEIKGE